MRIQHNIASMNAYRNYNNNTRALSKNLEKLSSGYKINRAGDDAAGLAISEKMRAQITGLNAATKNVKDGISLVKTAEGAMQEIHDMLNRMDYLATQSANGTYDNEVDRANLQKEVKSLKDEINRIADSANFNGIKLLDGSLDSTIKTKMNEIAEGFGIADWVGTTANNDAVVGDGTIVHTGGKEAVGTEFAIEFNNSTVAGKDGVSITLGDNEKISLDGTEIAQGASAEEIAAAFEKKLNGEIELNSTEGEKVKFNVKADGDRLVFTQAEAPTSSKQIVNGNMAVKYEGIGSGAVDSGDRLNVTVPTTKYDAAKNTAGTGANIASPALAWGTATDEQKDALNKALADGVDVKFTTTYDGTKNPTTVKADLKALQTALGDKFELAAANGTIDDTGTWTLASGTTATANTLNIVDKNTGDIVATLGVTTPPNATAITGATANSTGTTVVSLGAGNNQALNVPPAVTIEDTGKLSSATASAKKLFELETGLTADQLDALNKALAAGDQSISITASNLDGNTAKVGTNFKVELSQALKDAGYYITTDVTDAANDANKYDEENGLDLAAVANDTVLGLCDKDGTVIGKITLGTKAADTTTLTTDTSTITLGKSSFNSDPAVTKGIEAKNVQIKLEAAAQPDGGTATIAPPDWSADAAAYTWHEGDKFSVEIDGKTYEVTLKNGGLTDEEKKSGKFIDLTAAELTASATGAGTAAFGTTANSAKDMLAKLADAVQLQMNNEAADAAKGNADYTKVTGLKLSMNATQKGKIDVEANTQKFTYIEDAAAEDPDAPGSAVPGGKDPNASTVNIKQGAVASDGRLASTYLEASDFAGLKDGSQLRVGDVTYTFAVGKDSKVTGENVVDLTDMEASDADLLEKALVRLTEAGNPNAMFSIGNDEPGRVTFTENKDYTWGEGVDLSTHKGIAEQFGFYVDGVSTSGASGKSLTLQIGDTSDDFNQMKVSVGDMHTTGMGIEGVDISTQDGAAAAVDVIKNAINYVSSVRGDLGAIQNRLEHTQNNLSVMAENIQDAESTIRDTDVAEEMMSYVKNNILVQSAQAMLAQANQLPQGVLQLLG